MFVVDKKGNNKSFIKYDAPNLETKFSKTVAKGDDKKVDHI